MAIDRAMREDDEYDGVRAAGCVEDDESDQARRGNGQVVKSGLLGARVASVLGLVSFLSFCASVLHQLNPDFRRLSQY